jgi:hypothetical protein
MSETEAYERSRRRRRSREEADRLVLEYECSGMTREAFCRRDGLSVATLDNYRKRRRGGTPAVTGTVGQRPSSVALVAVDLVDGSPVAAGFADEAKLFVELAGGRRIGVAAGFDGATLRQLIGLLEQV